MTASRLPDSWQGGRTGGWEWAGTVCRLPCAGGRTSGCSPRARRNPAAAEPGTCCAGRAASSCFSWSKHRCRALLLGVRTSSSRASTCNTTSCTRRAWVRLVQRTWRRCCSRHCGAQMGWAGCERGRPGWGDRRNSSNPCVPRRCASETGQQRPGEGGRLLVLVWRVVLCAPPDTPRALAAAGSNASVRWAGIMWWWRRAGVKGAGMVVAMQPRARDEGWLRRGGSAGGDQPAASSAMRTLASIRSPLAQPARCPVGIASPVNVGGWNPMTAHWLRPASPWPQQPGEAGRRTRLPAAAAPPRPQNRHTPPPLHPPCARCRMRTHRRRRTP